MDPREERDLVGRLGEKIVGACVEPVHPVGGLIERRHQHDRNMRRCLVPFQAAADFQSVHSRHHHIEKNNVAIAVGADFQGIDAVRRGQNLKIFGA
jgi:hypothetical protein